MKDFLIKFRGWSECDEHESLSEGKEIFAKAWLKEQSSWYDQRWLEVLPAMYIDYSEELRFT